MLSPLVYDYVLIPRVTSYTSVLGPGSSGPLDQMNMFSIKAVGLYPPDMLSLAECQPGLLCLPNFKFTGFHADSVLWKSQLNVWLYDCMKLLCGLLLLMVAELLKKVLGHCIWLRNEREQMEHSIRSSNMKTCALIQLMMHFLYYMSIQWGQ